MDHPCFHQTGIYLSVLVTYTLHIKLDLPVAQIFAQIASLGPLHQPDWWAAIQLCFSLQATAVELDYQYS
jgi:hypothetical protein